MHSKDYKTLKRYWNLNGLGYITLATNQDLHCFLNFHSIQDILSEREFFQWDKIRILKRQKEWLLGRYTAKLLLQNYFEKNNRETSLPNIELLSQLGTKPKMVVKGKDFSDVDLSLSHVENVATAALTSRRNLKIGVDIEKTKKLSEKVYQYFLSSKELIQIKNNPFEKDKLITLLWTLKEATLKALGIGLHGSLKGIVVNISQHQPRIRISQYNLQRTIQCEPRKIYSFYKTIDGYNLAIVLLES